MGNKRLSLGPRPRRQSRHANRRAPTASGIDRSARPSKGAVAPINAEERYLALGLPRLLVPAHLVGQLD
jgi:hypothetical protein